MPYGNTTIISTIPIKIITAKFRSSKKLDKFDVRGVSKCNISVNRKMKRSMTYGNEYRKVNYSGVQSNG